MSLVTSSRAAFMAMLGWIAACTLPQEPDVSPDPPEPASPVSDASAQAKDPTASAASASSATPAPSVPIAAWTDAAAIDGLARDCSYAPKEALRMGEDSGALACTHNLFSQSCVADPCYADDQEKCKPKCASACTSCDADCSSSCNTCKEKCTDDSCRRACAVQCGECKHACLTAKDRCATGTCGQEYAACTKALTAKWKSTGCSQHCRNFNACAGRCSEDNAGPCQDACYESLMRVCPNPLAGMCRFNGFGPGEEPKYD